MRMTKERIRRLTINGAMALAAVFTLSAESSAEYSAMAGRAQLFANESCFTNSAGRITNTCTGGSRQWCVAVPQFSSGNKSATVNVFRPLATHIGCFGVSTNSAGGVVSQTPTSEPNIAGMDQFISLGTVNIVSEGAGFVCCDLVQNARLNTVDIQ